MGSVFGPIRLKMSIYSVCSMCIKINKVGKQEVGIWWVQKHFPQYGVPIWSLLIFIHIEHTLYMLIFSHIFLSNYWWQKSDIWSQASYRYPISWEVFLDLSDSYFLFADFVDFYTHWTYTKNVHICSMCIKTNQVGKQEVGIWRIQKCYPQYGIPIWCLWPNIRFLPSTVTEKKVAFLDPSDSYFLFADLVGFYTHWTYMHIFRHIFLSNYWWQKSDIWSQASYRYPISLYEACDQISDFCHQ
jgi:ribosomal protein L37AE/L43A